MNRASSWINKEPDFNVRDAAEEAARAAGLNLHEWLAETWRLHAAEIQASVEDLDDDERAYAVARRISRRRMAAHASRRSDRFATSRRPNHDAPARSADERIWTRVNQALNTFESEQAAEVRSADPVETRTQYREPEARSSRQPRGRVAAPPPPARSRLSIDAAMDEIAERQMELERPGRRAAPQPSPEQPLLRQELAKVAEALADLRRDTAESASSVEVEALRREVVQIAQGLTALAPRETIEHIQAAVHDLASRVAEARTVGLVDEFISPVEELIYDLKRSLLGAAPTAALEAIEKRIGALARNVEALAETRIDPDSVGSLLEHSQDIRAMLSTAAANRPNVEALEKRIGELGGRIDRISERGATSAGLDAIVKSVAQIRADLETQNPIKAVKALDGRIDALSRKMDQAASRSDVDAHFDRLSKRLDSMHRDLAERAPDSRKLEDMFIALQARIDQARPAASATEMRDLVSQLMGKLDQAIGAGAEPSSLSALEEQISRVAARLETRGDSRADGQSKDLARIEGLLGAISQRLENPLPISAVDQVQATVRLLIERFDATLRTGVTGETLAAIEQRLADVAQKLDAPATNETLTSIERRLADVAQKLDAPAADDKFTSIERKLAEVTQKLDAPATGDSLTSIERRLADVAQKLDAPVTAELDTARLESMIQDLAARMVNPALAETDVASIKQALAQIADRMDAALRGDGEQGAIQGLEDQIAALTQRMEKASEAGVAKLERSMDDIQEQMERLRSELDSPVREALEREISDLRSLHSAADRRTHATLNAVHETLEKVVDRLAMLENEIEPPAPVKAPGAAAAMRRDELDDYKPSIDLKFEPPKTEAEASAKPMAPPSPSVSTNTGPARAPLAPAEAQKVAPPTADAQVRADQTMRRVPPAPAAPKLGSAIGDDFLLEPGSGKPSPRDAAPAAPPAQSTAAPPAASANAATFEDALDAALNRPATPAAGDLEAGDAQANFIAAVRRAQQSASAPREGGSTGNQLLDEARARARAAAAEAEAQQTKSSKGGAFGLKSLFSGRKKATTAAGITGLVVILGALQAANMFYQSDRSRPMRTAQNNAVAPAPAAPEKATARAEAPRLGLASPPADRFTQASPLADMTPVASVPVNASPARNAVPAAPRDPMMLAAAGDAHAQYELGVRLAEGRHGPRDPAKALDWLTKSADQKFAPAQYRLGVIYEKGIGVPRDSARARALYLAAAERGNVKAMHNLGALLADGGAEGKPDYAAAARWFKRAAEHGVRDSQYNLAILAARGLGLQQDLVESYVWFSAASLQGDADAGAKMKEVASRLDAAQLTRAQATAKAHRVRPVDPAVNEPLEPEGGWATAPEPNITKPSASRSPKISSLQTR